VDGRGERTYAGPTVEPTTWAVITASAVGRTVTHVNARERERERERKRERERERETPKRRSSSQRRSCYLGSLAGGAEMRRRRELAGFILAISAATTRARASERNFSARPETVGTARTEPHTSANRVRTQTGGASCNTFRWKYYGWSRGGFGIQRDETRIYY